MIRVNCATQEHGERLLQRFKRMCLRAGLFKEMKRRQYYEKPSQRRRREAQECRRAVLKAERKKTSRGSSKG